MMRATGVLFLGKTAPLASVAADGMFTLTLLAMDRIGPHQVEPWRITWAGPAAHQFWSEYGHTVLKPGQPIEVALERIRTFTTGKWSAAESHAHAVDIRLAPLAHEISRRPAQAA